MANTNDPKWNQTFVYEGIRRVSELRKRALEITVWDYGKYDTNDFLGEVVLELGAARFDEEAEWHPLTGHSEHRHIGYVKQISIHIRMYIYIHFIYIYIYLRMFHFIHASEMRRKSLKKKNAFVRLLQ